MSGSSNLAGSTNNLVSNQQHQPQQLQQHLESINGESSNQVAQHQLPRYLDDLPSYSCQYASEAYDPSVKYDSPRSCSGSPWDQRSNRSPRLPDVQKFRCEENLQRYPQRCREEYYHRCSESNLSDDRYVESLQHQQQQEQQHKYWSDTNEYLQRYPEDKTVMDDPYPTTTTTDLQKFPQYYSEDPLRPIYKYPSPPLPGLRCPDHYSKYISAKPNSGFFTNRILSPGGLPMIGQTAIGLVVNKFGSGPLDHHYHHHQLSRDNDVEHGHYSHHPYPEQSGFCPCESSVNANASRDDEEYLDARYMMNNSISDSD